MPKEPIYYPLTTSQQIMYVSQKYCIKKSVVDICVMLYFDCDMDFDLLLQSFNLAMRRCKSAKVRLHKVGKEIKQYISEQDINPVIVMDYSDRTEEELEADLNRWSQTPFPNKSMDVQLFSVRLIKEPNGFYGIYFCVSHLAFDAYALMKIASDAMEIYVALQEGKAIPKAKDDYLKCCETDWEYQKSEKKERDLKYWADEVFATEPMFTAVEPEKQKMKTGKRTGPNIDILHPKAYYKTYKIEADLAKKVYERSKELRVSPQAFYLLALRSYLSKSTGDTDDVTLMNSIARRATLVQKRAGGTRVLAIPFRMKLDQEMDIISALNEVARLQVDYYRHSDLLVTDITAVAFDKYREKATVGYHSIGMTFNPYYVTFPEGIKAHMSLYSTGANSQPIYLSIMALDSSGALSCIYDCMKSFTKEDTAEKIHKHIVKALEAMTSDTSLTLADLNRL